MRNPTIAILFLILSLSLMSCGDGSNNTFKEPPLTEKMSFTYQETTEYKGKVLKKTIGIRFQKRDDGMFDSIKTYTDKYGSREQDPLIVDGFFKYNKVMDTLISSHPLWRDPNVLASGNIGSMDVVEDTFNGKNVYACLQGEHEKQYYDMETGFLEGAYIDTGKAKETVVRTE